MITILCPYCETEAEEPENDVKIHVCKVCRREFSVAAQYAYTRGQAYYTAAFDIESAARGRVKEDSPAMTDMLRNYMRAYSGLRVALQHKLPRSYQADALSMLAEIMQRFFKREMVSSLESSYWTKRITQWTAQKEHQEIQQKLAAKEGNFLRRWHWRLRSAQLARALPKLSASIAEMETAIAFIKNPVLS